MSDRYFRDNIHSQHPNASIRNTIFEVQLLLEDDIKTGQVKEIQENAIEEVEKIPISSKYKHNSPE